MHYLKIKFNLQKISLLIGFSFLYLLVNLLGTFGDSINPDAVNWHGRSEQFIVALKTLNLKNTYQHYHPGVTLMWIMGVPIELLKQVSPNDKTYNHLNFLVFDLVGNYFLVFVHLTLTLFLIYFLSQIKKFEHVLLFACFLILEPFYLANSRIIHLDTLLTLFIFLSLLTSYLYLQHKLWYYAVLAGIFSSMAFLSKSVGILVLLFIFAFITVNIVFTEKKLYLALKFGTLFIGAFLVTLFTLLPAMWVNPIYVITHIFTEAERVGVREGHDQIIFGELKKDAGFYYYFLVFFIKSTVFTIFGVLGYFLINIKFDIITFLKKRTISFELFAFLFFVGYLLLLFISTKKLDRYFVVCLPFFILLSTNFWVFVLEKLSSSYKKFILAFMFITYTFIYYQNNPYFFTYNNVLFGSAQNVNNIVGQKPFGTGMLYLKNYILYTYGCINNVQSYCLTKVPYYPKVGMIDTKPLKTIYMGSRIFDIRVSGLKKLDIVILGPNEELTPEIEDKLDSLVLIDTVKINNMDFWRIYEPKN